MAKKKEVETKPAGTEEAVQTAKANETEAVRYPVIKGGRFVCSDGARYESPRLAEEHEYKLKKSKQCLNQ